MKSNVVSICHKTRTERERAIQQAVNRRTVAFQRGLAMGKAGIFRGKLPVDPSEEGIVEIIQNLIDFALEGHLTEELLRQDIGIVVGFVLKTPRGFHKVRGGD